MQTDYKRDMHANNFYQMLGLSHSTHKRHSADNDKNQWVSNGLNVGSVVTGNNTAKFSCVDRSSNC